VNPRATSLVVRLAGAIAVFWISRHIYWADVEVPALPKGEALTNPFTQLSDLPTRLARERHTIAPSVPPTDAVLVLSGWLWSVSDRRRPRSNDGSKRAADWSSIKI
jgi:hypothetical protein